MRNRGSYARLGKRKEDLDHGWRWFKAWIAHFDLLGFKAKIETEPMYLIQEEVDEIVRDFKAEAKEFEKNLAYQFYADTFIFYSKSDENNNYPGLLHAATHFMEKCIYKGIALRGAISFGEIAIGNDNRIMIGRAFLESHQYCEDQDWLGLILTPTASDRLKNQVKLDPIHRFIYGEIPWRKCGKSSGKVYAYSFCRGAYSFPCPLRHKLEEMRHLSPSHAKHKYENTIRFVERHWRMIQP